AGPAVRGLVFRGEARHAALLHAAQRNRVAGRGREGSFGGRLAVDEEPIVVGRTREYARGRVDRVNGEPRSVFAFAPVGGDARRVAAALSGSDLRRAPLVAVLPFVFERHRL